MTRQGGGRVGAASRGPRAPPDPAVAAPPRHGSWLRASGLEEGSTVRLPTVRHTAVRLAIAIVLALTGGSDGWAQAGKQIVIGQSVDAVTLDPQMSTQLQVMNLFWNIYDCLTVFDDSMQLRPQLATSWRN